MSKKGQMLSAVVVLLGLFMLHSFTAFSRAAMASTDYIVEEVANGLGVIWGMTFIGVNELLFTERDGKIGKFLVDTGRKIPIQGGPKVFAEGQGGLLDVAIPPGYLPGEWIYFTYSKEIRNQGVTTLGRAKLQGDKLLDWQDIFVSRSATDTSHHFGSRIAFDGKGHLFFSIGDRGKRPNGQDTTNHAGSILRLKVDGSVPSDNPFVESKKHLPEVYSYGHRNPQGLAYDFATGKLWSNEHGPRGGDEINLIEPGKNYGWPVVSHGKEYWGPVAVGEAEHLDGMEDPLKVYIPSIAPGSLLIYSGPAFADWRGNLFSGALVLEHLNQVVVDNKGNITGEQRLLSELGERIRALAQSPEGWIYFSTDSGRIMRIMSGK